MYDFYILVFMFFFFKQKTAYEMRISDWSSDVCSSDLNVRPNAAHEALARLDAAWPGELLIVTQNVDDLHERAGAARLIHMHGEHLNAWCSACDQRSPWTGPLIDRPACPACGLPGTLRPDKIGRAHV